MAISCTMLRASGQAASDRQSFKLCTERMHIVLTIGIINKHDLVGHAMAKQGCKCRVPRQRTCISCRSCPFAMVRPADTLLCLTSVARYAALHQLLFDKMPAMTVQNKLRLRAHMSSKASLEASTQQSHERSDSTKASIQHTSHGPASPCARRHR